ncbi:MAG: hypothetical protein HZB24_03605 [Desulfobacterales bacterium]|nr:hypothetical protein [Desulfobacterales bacterium]
MATPSSLRNAIVRVLTPLVRILLRNGVSYGTFAEIAKEVFTRVALQEFDIQGRKQSISRVAVITGLTRKAVKEAMEQPSEQVDDLGESYNRAARVIAGWRRDPEFQSPDGQPDRLPFHGTSASFTSLVKRYSGDVPARAVLDELKRTEAVAQSDDGRVELLVRAYLPAGDAQMKLHILGTDVAHLIATIGHNLHNDPSQAHLQRKVAYDNLPQEALAPFRRMATEKAQALLETLDRHLSQQDRDNRPDIGGTGRFKAGVGIYYFEEPVNDE